VKTPLLDWEITRRQLAQVLEVTKLVQERASGKRYLNRKFN
jgi:hypothetical protein